MFLDSALRLTRGPIFVPTGALLSTLAYATGIFTYVYQDGGEPIVGQASHEAERVFARMAFVTPANDIHPEALSRIVEKILPVLGERRIHHIMAEVDEKENMVALMRQAGFGIYARQRIWQLAEKKFGSLPKGWRSTRKVDAAGVSFLVANLVPGLVQQVESMPENGLNGLVYYRGNEMLAFVRMVYGMKGILAQPFVHPDADDVAEDLVGLLQNLPDLYFRPVFLCVRSYQSWLEPVLEAHDARVSLNQAVMVRHLAVTRKVAQKVVVPALNGSTAEPTVPITQIEME